MMGSVPSGGKGIIPRLCDLMFDRIAELRSEDTNFKVEVSYMEIYNEKVHDLLDPKGYLLISVRTCVQCYLCVVHG